MNTVDTPDENQGHDYGDHNDWHPRRPSVIVNGTVPTEKNFTNFPLYHLSLIQKRVAQATEEEGISYPDPLE